MAEMNRLNMDDLDGVSGGRGTDSWMTVFNIQAGYLAVRKKPEAAYGNEINHVGLQNGDRVRITGSMVNGSGFGGSAKYVWVYVPKYEVSGYVNAAYLM